MAKVKNHFNQPPNGTDVDDNELVIGGTVTQPAGGALTLGGTVSSSGGANLKTKLANVRITDISTAGSVWVTPGFAGSVIKISSVIDGAITVGDAILDPQIGGVSITDGGITIANVASAAGVVDQSTPTAANVFTASESIEIATDGGSTDTASSNITLELLPS